MFTFNHFNFNVADLDKSIQFYHDALGLERAGYGQGPCASREAGLHLLRKSGYGHLFYF